MGHYRTGVGMVIGGAGGLEPPTSSMPFEALSQMSYSPKLSTRRGRRLQGNIAKALGSGKVATLDAKRCSEMRPLRRSPTFLR